MTTINLITPALADANNGNWQTAYRWAKFLSDQFDVRTAKEWQAGVQAAESPAMMIALHARRSASSIAAFAQTGQPIALVMTGTDLYRDIHRDPAAQRSLELAHRLVVLHDHGVHDLPEQFRSKTRVIFQSARSLIPAEQPVTEVKKRYFDLALVGHIRAEKDPITALKAIQLLSATSRSPSSPTVRLIHIGSDKDETLGQAFRELASTLPQVILKGNLSNPKTRQIIKQCDALVLPSVMEGGANVLIEAVTAGVPVLASRISGSVGMLGEDYSGYFQVGNALDLSQTISRCLADKAFLNKLRRQCERRAHLFEPQREKLAVLALANELLKLPRPKLTRPKLLRPKLLRPKHDGAD
jgi:putative glycosyltransferase (TIGR04348 family)